MSFCGILHWPVRQWVAG
uniref:Uncharacterized protein n=1 Tax=Arundo donax TaxID=35708 RepID=A0A0A8ZSD1_ARUDO